VKEPEEDALTEPLWRPSAARAGATLLNRFMREVADEERRDCTDPRALGRYAIEEPDRFWRRVWTFASVAGEMGDGAVLEDGARMPGARFFPKARLNFAENLLSRRKAGEAIVFRGEDRVRRRLSHGQLAAQVARLARALEAAGVAPGDRVAGYLPNMPEAVIAMLATAALGAVWSSCSPDFGVDGVVDRFGQIAPKVLFAADGYIYGGKTIDRLETLKAVLARLPALERTVVVPYVGDAPSLAGLPGAVLWSAFVAPFASTDLFFIRFPFNHPLYILYSSGTTGKPKCIVHGAGGTLLQHLKEHQLHCDIRPGDRVFYYTTCGWMMWNWLVSSLASGATLLLYDGSPFHPHPAVLFDWADAEGMTFFGTSARYLDAIAKTGIRPKHTHGLVALKTIASTGSPLSPDSFAYVYREIKTDVHLASISGGTDLISCFVLGNPLEPVWPGEIQGPGLGMAVDVVDEDGQALPFGKGELICRRPFPSMPVGFWNDPDGARYRAAYFERFPGVWHHGDYVEWTVHGGMIIHGRSDATLNPGGVRIGTAEIYRQVARLDEVMEAVAVGQDRAGDVRVILFVVLKPGRSLDDELSARIKTVIRDGTSPRHVPAKVIQVPDIPRTKSGKITELAVRDIIHGRAVKNAEALANPETLELFSDLPELRT
jgi:acetoacetyl-CoA synthetase